jgi:uncharacterized membrane protein SirB2
MDQTQPFLRINPQLIDNISKLKGLFMFNFIQHSLLSITSTKLNEKLVFCISYSLAGEKSTFTTAYLHGAPFQLRPFACQAIDF